MRLIETVSQIIRCSYFLFIYVAFALFKQKPNWVIIEVCFLAFNEYYRRNCS